MKLRSAPDACPSINVAGVEYSPDASGEVEISIPEHVAAAKREGFTEVAEANAPAEEITHYTGE